MEGFWDLLFDLYSFLKQIAYFQENWIARSEERFHAKLMLNISPSFILEEIKAKYCLNNNPIRNI